MERTDKVREFFTARSAVAIPDTVARLFDDVAERTTRIHDRGLARIVECADPDVAELIAHDSRTRKHCMLAGDRHLVVPASSEAAFKRTLREVGYLVAMGEALPANPRRKAAGKKAGSRADAPSASSITNRE